MLSQTRTSTAEMLQLSTKPSADLPVWISQSLGLETPRSKTSFKIFEVPYWWILNSSRSYWCSMARQDQCGRFINAQPRVFSPADKGIIIWASRQDCLKVTETKKSYALRLLRVMANPLAILRETTSTSTVDDHFCRRWNRTVCGLRCFDNMAS